MKRIPLVLVPLLLLPHFHESAGAGEIPESALSRGSLLRPEFLDSEGLMFRFPQRAASFDAQIFGMNNGGGSVSTGALARLGGQGLFFLTQPIPDFIPGASELYQIGWGGAFGTVRLGIAARGTYRTEENAERLDDEEENHERYNRQRNDRTRKTLEGAAGLGIRTDRWTVDLAVERRFESVETNEVITREQNGFPFEYTFESTLFRAKVRVDPVWETTMRIAVRPSGESEIIAFGSYARPVYEREGYAEWDSLRTDFAGVNEYDAWAGGVALRFSTDLVDRITFSSLLREYAIYDVNAIYSDEFDRTLYRKAWAGVSFDQEVFADLTARAGIEGRYEDRSRRRERYYRYDHTITRDNDESFGKSFSWGATYRWRNVLLNGAVSTDLDLWDLFVALDAHLYF